MAGPGGNGAGPSEREPTIDVLPNAPAASLAAATLIAGALAEAVRLRGRADWATTGGSTPIPIYRHLAVAPLRDLVPWDHIHVWWGDDRYVPRDHPLSNCLAFDQALLNAGARTGAAGDGAAAIDIHLGAQPGVPLPVANVHRMPIDESLARGSPEEAAAAYEAELRAAPLEHDPAGVPILDVVLVGVGPDGHVFSVFPGSPLLDSPALVSAVPAPEHVAPHVARISLSPRFLTAARLPIAVVLGASKAEIIQRILGGPRDVRRWPAQLARRPGAAWFLDAASAARLRPAEPGR